MKFLLFTLEYPPFHGGVANYYGSLTRHWPEPENIFVLNNNGGGLIHGSFPVLKWLPAYFALRRKINQDKIDHIIAGQILPLGTIAWFCSKFRKTKYSVILHGMDLAYALKTPRKRWLAEKIMNNSEKIICSNSYAAEMARQSFPGMEQKIKIVNPGVENPLSRNSRLITQIKNQPNLNNRIILLSVGRLVKRKGFDKVIEAMPEVLKKVPNLVYIILGGGEELDNFKLKILKLKLNNNIKIINQTTDEERDSWYNGCGIFIMPSRNINGDFEGFGIVYLEANLAGKPVIAGRSGGAADAVIDGFNGLLVDPENVNDIASAIVKLAKNPELRHKMGEQGRERAIKEFTWRKQIEKIYIFLSA